MAGVKKNRRLEIADIIGGAWENRIVSLHGSVHAKRDMGGITFLTLRKRDGTVQCVCGEEIDLSGIPEEAAVVVTGTVRKDSRAPGGFEVAVTGIDLQMEAEPESGH